MVASLVAATTATAGPARFGIVIGNNLGADTARTLQWAESDAKRVHSVLTEIGGFEDGRLRLVLGGSADDAWRAIRDTEADIRRAKRRGQKTMLVVYYSGHADSEALELGKTRLQFAELRDVVRRSKADIRIALVDSCHAGTLVAHKGGKRGPAFAIDVGDGFDASGYAIITSSAHSELSQESGHVRGAWFTHFLISALRGAGDQTGDGRVTLTEAYRYAYARTVARTMATTLGGQHPMYDYKLSGRGDVVLTMPGGHGSRVRVTTPGDGRLMVLDGRGERMVAELDTKAGHPATVAVPPGRYRVYLLGKSAVRQAAATVRHGKAAVLNAADFEEVRLARAIPRGGLFTTRPSLRLSAAATARRFPLEEGAAGFGGALVLGFEPIPQLLPTLRLQVVAAPDAGVSKDYLEASALLGIGWRKPLGAVALRLEVATGYEHLFQSDGHTSGLAWQGIAGLDIPFSNLFLRLDVAAGGRLFTLKETDDLQHRLDLQATLGLGWQLDL